MIVALGAETGLVDILSRDGNTTSAQDAFDALERLLRTCFIAEAGGVSQDLLLLLDGKRPYCLKNRLFDGHC